MIMLYLVPMYRSASALSISTKISTSNLHATFIFIHLLVYGGLHHPPVYPFLNDYPTPGEGCWLFCYNKQKDGKNVQKSF